MAKFLYNGPCPFCGSKDNRGHYDDGSEWCWGCNKYTPPSIASWVKAEEVEEKTFTLPDDLSTNFPEQIIKYIQKYDIQTEEILREGYKWSEKYQSLYALYYSDSSSGRHILAANIRRMGQDVSSQNYGKFGKNKKNPKYVFVGRKSDVFPIFRGSSEQREASNRNKQTLVLTEDALSSLKIGRQSDAMPLFGTSLSMDKTNRIAGLYSRCVVWLDGDKFREAWEIATKLKWLGVSTKVVLTKCDPKEYTDDEITGYLK